MVTNTCLINFKDYVRTILGTLQQNGVAKRRNRTLLDMVRSMMTQANLIIYTAALAYTKDPKYHGRTKHIDVCFHYIRDMVVRGEVTLNHISTSRMVANPLTKATSRSVFQTHVGSMGLCRL